MRRGWGWAQEWCGQCHAMHFMCILKAKKTTTRKFDMHDICPFAYFVVLSLHFTVDGPIIISSSWYAYCKFCSHSLTLFFDYFTLCVFFFYFGFVFIFHEHLTLFPGSSSGATVSNPPTHRLEKMMQTFCYIFEIFLFFFRLLFFLFSIS